MKIFKHILLYAMAIFFVVVACEREGYIDPVSKVEPGPDEEPPVVEMEYPTEGAAIRVKEDVTSIDIKFEVIDDIEIQSITLELNGTEIAEFTEFKDYRRVVDVYTYDELTNGEHTLTITATDMDGKNASKVVNFEKIAPYETQYDGEIFYMPFDGSAMELISITNAEVVGNPGYESGLINQAYKGAPASYLSYPSDTLINDAISASFWYNVNVAESRAGILTIGRPSENDGDRTQGFRLFRVGNASSQTIRLNVGKGEGDSWYTAGGDYSLDPADANWVHVAFTISRDSVAIFIDGELAAGGEFEGPISWEGCETLSIGSGAPNFSIWNHLSDVDSRYDELRFFNKVLTQEEILTLMNEAQ